MKKTIVILAVFWTAAVGASLAWNLHHQNQETLAMARSEAQLAFEKDLVYRRWIASHGGVYVPVTDQTPPNPYLDVPEREITTPSGRLLTLMNPAYMTRQVHELGKEQYGARGHITSLNPIRPENAADPWETESLKAFERGETETSSVEEIEGEPYMRLMRPLITEESCLQCHAIQGYQLGDIRGGLSVSVPMAPLQVVSQNHLLMMLVCHGMLWLLGLAGLGWGARRIRQHAFALKDRVRELTCMYGVAESIRTHRRVRDVFAETAKLIPVGWHCPGSSTHGRIQFNGKEYVSDDFMETEWRLAADIIVHGKAEGVIEVFCTKFMKKERRLIDGIAAALGEAIERRRAAMQLSAAKDAAELANRAKSEFLANMSHEIRTPLTAMLGFAEMLEMDGDMAKAPESRLGAIATIRRNGDHLLQIINDILDLSKMDAEMLEIKIETCDLQSIVHGTVESFRSLARPGVELTADCPTVAIKSSPVRLRQILLNLVGNAVKFTESGSVKVTATVNQDQMTICVKDTGPGMTQNQAGELFSAFHQLDNSATRKYGGTGLGLAISHRLAHMMGGNVEVVQAELNVGCTFQLTLPITVVNQTAFSNGVESVPNAAQGLRFLVVEDREDNRAFLTSMLTALKASKVSVAHNGEQGVESVANGEYDVILMDMQMPVMDGWTATRLLRESGCVIPIVAVTANAMDGDCNRCIAAGCDSYVSKPMNGASLSSAIARAIEHAETPAAALDT